MEYWHDLVTEKSWRLLQQIKGKFEFVLIGGWAVYLLARSQKSKDIDIIVSLDTLHKIKAGYELRKNDALKKYEVKIGEIDIDIYVPYYSRLALPAEKVESVNLEGFDVARPEELVILKQGAEEGRRHSEKGEKDRIDIMSLLMNCEFDFRRYRQILKSNNKENMAKGLYELVRGFTGYNYFNRLPSEFKKKKLQLLDSLRKL